MRKQIIGNTINIWLSANDTYNWAHKAGAVWPCSTLANKRLFAQFIDGDLVDITINGRDAHDIDGAEFNAIISDFLGSVNPTP